MSTSFRARLRAAWGIPACIALAAAAVPAWAQKLAAGYAGFEVDLVYQAPDIEHPSVVTCDPEGNLFVGEDPMDMRGPPTKEIDRVVLIRWDQKTAAPRKTVFCQNLSAVFGLIWQDGALYVMHAPHYSVFRDTDGDGVADSYETICDSFGLTGNYHEFAFGPLPAPDGGWFVALNTASSGAGVRQEVRGEYRDLGREGRMYSVVPWRGWVVKISPDGKLTPWASGFR
ncbi:MAG TPA: hypothetical protein VGG30_12300, partial [Pirellulales bacterium]